MSKRSRRAVTTALMVAGMAVAGTIAGAVPASAADAQGCGTTITGNWVEKKVVYKNCGSTTVKRKAAVDNALDRSCQSVSPGGTATWWVHPAFGAITVVAC